MTNLAEMMSIVADATDRCANPPIAVITPNLPGDSLSSLETVSVLDQDNKPVTFQILRLRSAAVSVRPYSAGIQRLGRILRVAQSLLLRAFR